MTRKKSVILGPDGKPYVAPKPKVEPKVTVELAGVDVSADVKDYTFTFERHLSPSFGSIYQSLMDSPIRAKHEAKKPLAEAVADQVGALAADFDGVGGAELPQPEPDLHTYADAYASAVKKCRHPNPESTMYARGEFFCPDCQRYFGPEEYKATRDGGLFGRWFS